jgi:uncharacterized membrane protein YbhN (UPF0104 family)
MRILLTAIGIIALLIGLIWAGQGLNIINWPSASLMINQIKWTYIGLGVAAVGLILIWLGRR